MRTIAEHLPVSSLDRGKTLPRRAENLAAPLYNDSNSYENKLEKTTLMWETKIKQVKSNTSNRSDVLLLTLDLIDILAEKKADIPTFFLKKPNDNCESMLDQLVNNKCWLACSFLHSHFSLGYYDNGQIKVTESTLQKRVSNNQWYGIKKYDSEDLYGGDLVDNLPQGWGLMEFRAGGYHEGQWREGRENGPGLFKFAASGFYQKGEFKDGESNAKIRNQHSLVGLLRKFFRVD